jgi:hypothetical protein
VNPISTTSLSTISVSIGSLGPPPRSIGSLRRARPRRRWLVQIALVVAVAGICLGPSPVSADQEPYRLRNTDALFLGAEVGASAVVYAGGSLALRAVENPGAGCGWCETNDFDRWMRRLLLVEEGRAAAVTSDLLLVGIVPAVSLSGVIVPALVHDQGRYAIQDTAIMINAVLTTALATDLAKTLFARRRPDATYARRAEGEARVSSRREMRSFFSGHASLSCSIAASASTLAFLRGYELAPYLALGSGAAALTTSILRMVADRHWATDVLAGVVVGTLAGVLIPLALHPRERPDGGPAGADTGPMAGSAWPGQDPALHSLPTPIIFAW